MRRNPAINILKIIAFALTCFAASGAMSAEQTVTEKLRLQVRSSNSKKLGIRTFTKKHNVWGIVVDMGFPKDTLTLIALSDGTTSVYFLKSGGGMIGGGKHESVRAAAAELILAADEAAGDFSPSTTFPLVKLQHVRFYALAQKGVLASKDLPAQKLEAGSGALKRLYAKAHEVIGKLREIEENKSKN